MADKAYYNGDLVDTKILSVEGSEVTVEDNSVWRQFIAPQPVGALVFQTGMSLTGSPWFNLDESILFC